MTKKELKKQLKKYNPKDHYIFISYSSNDVEVIWKDAIALQKMGYNVWLDEINLDIKKDNWIQDALPVIENIKCSILIFYLSPHSLRSANCLLELTHTEHENTLDKRADQALDFILVETEPVSDLKDYISQIHKEIIKDTALPDKIQNEQAETITKFIRFFTQNDRFAKIRVHPSGGKYSDEDRLEDICDAFPDEIQMQKLSIDPHSAQTLTAAHDTINQEILYENGSRYIGQVRDGIPHGLGQLQDQKGYVYFGEWKNGKKDGWGKLTYPDKSKTSYFFGQMKEDKKNGWGVSVYKDGNTVCHQWSNGDHNDGNPV